jgi:hypothetical protein
MSFEEFPDCFIWQCDRCHLEAVFPRGNFWSALAELKGRGWQITRLDDWVHRCAKCKKIVEAEILNMTFPVRRVRE